MKIGNSKLFLIVAFCYVAGFFAHAFLLQKTVYGDGIFYYSWLRSVVIDQDINFQNEYTHFDVSQPVTALGLPGNKYSVGPALVWAPGFVWIHTLMRGTGYELPYQLMVGATSVGYALFGLLLLYRLLRIRFSEGTSIASIAATAGATNLLFYGAVDPVNSHAVSFFSAALFLSFLFQKKRNWLLIGASLGLIALIRTQDLIYAILLTSLFKRPRSLEFRFEGEALRKFALGFICAFTPQLLAWYATTGTVISPYLSGGEGFDFLHPNIFSVLFSPQNGLLLWTPMVLLGFVGFIRTSHQLRSSRFSLLTSHFLLIILLQLLLVSSWSSWNQGASYSGRMFVSVLPLVAFGLATLFSKLYYIKLRGLPLYLAIIFPLTIINMILIIFFLWNLS